MIGRKGFAGVILALLTTPALALACGSTEVVERTVVVTERVEVPVERTVVVTERCRGAGRADGGRD
jgi:hypothetical protein